MAWSSAELSATELALIAADKPALASNALKAGVLTSAIWRDSGGTDRSQTAYPTSRAYDGKPGLMTFPSTSGTTMRLQFVFSTAIEFDCIAVVGHEITTADGVTMALEIADDSAYTSNQQTISNLSAFTTNTRIADTTLYHTGATARRYSGVLYARLNFTAAGAETPKIGEVIFGRRRILKAAPNVPWDPYSLTSEVRDFVSANGQVSRTTLAAGRFNLNARLSPWETAYTDDLEAWHTATEHGNAPFIWWTDASEANDFHLMHLRESSMPFAYVGPFQRDAEISAFEQGPENYYLSQEP